MYVYIIMLLFSLFFIAVYKYVKGQKNYKNVYMMLSAMPFFLISALRYNVGTDYLYRYQTGFITMQAGYKVNGLEWGFSLINKIIIKLGGDYKWLFIITSAIIIFPIFYVIFNYSENEALAVLLFFLGGYFFQSLNILREYIAIAIVLSSNKFLLEKKYGRWFLMIFIASSIHAASYVAISLFLCQKMKEISAFKLFVFSAIVFVLKKPIRLAVNMFLGYTRFYKYVNSLFDVSEVKETLIIVNLVIYLIIYYCYTVDRSASQDSRFWLNVQAIGVIAITFGMVSYLFYRIAFYFTIFQLISVPRVLEKTRYKKLFTCLLCIFLSVSLIYTNVINNNEEVLPYRSYFSEGIW